MEIRYALRSLRKSPGFALIATFTLAVGIALTTTTYSLIDSVRHPYVAFREPERLFRVLPWGTGTSGQVSNYEKNVAVVQGTRSFEIASSSGFYDSVRAPAFEGELSGVRVSANYFAVYGLTPSFGRLFDTTASADVTGQAVISSRFWDVGFAKKPLEAGLRFTAGSRAYEVIGIVGTSTNAESGQAVFWTRESGATVNQYTRGGLLVRLKDGVTLADANSELAVVARQLTTTFGEGRQPFSFQLYPLAPQPEALTDSQKALAGASIAILLIACVNLANLMLARAINRRRELAVRMALGASRGSLIRHVLAESAVIAGAGGALGTLLMVAGNGLLRTALPAMVPVLGRLSPMVSWRVYAFALVTTAASAIVFGLGPALRASDVDLNEPLKDGAGTTGRGRYRYSGLVIAEVAICLTLLMWAGLTTRAVARAAEYDYGYDAEHTLFTMRNFPKRSLPDDMMVNATWDALLEKVRSIPGVLGAASYVSAMPGSAGITSDLEGPEPRFGISLYYYTVSPGYFGALGIPILSGRDFEAGDQQGTEIVAVIDQVAAAKLYPDVDPIGRMVKVGAPDAPSPWARIVAVARPINVPGGMDPEPRVFVVNPTRVIRTRSIAVRVSPGTDAPAVLNRAISTTIYGRAIELRPMTAASDDAARARVFLVRVFTALGGLSLLLTAVGLYGVLAYSVSRRMREFALRMALGAQRGTLLRLVFRDGAAMVLAGTAIGAWVAMWAARFLEPWLDSIPRTDAIALIVAELLLVGVSLVACWIPAVRATRADPMEVIRAI